MNGARNSVDTIQVSNAKGYLATAVAYCMNLNLNGYTDWYLPARQEMTSLIFPNRGAIGGFQADWYWTSCWGSNTDACISNMNDGSGSGAYVTDNRWIRCARRDDIPLPTEKVYNDPTAISVVPTVSFTTPFRATSSTFTVNGVTVPVTVSISGGVGNPTFTVNGGPEVTTASVTRGQTIRFLMDTPATLGTQNTATINWGPTKTYSWTVGYADVTRTLKVFVTSALYNVSNLGGLAGGDAKCNALAAVSPYGLSASWKMLGSDKSVNAVSRIPWSWGTMYNLDGTIVVDGGFSDLFDGTLDNAILIDDKGNIRSDSVWTGASSAGGNDGSTSNCNNFSSWPYNTEYSNFGYANSSTSTWIASGGGYCGDNRRIYCVENISAAVDTTPTTISLSYTIQAASGSRQVSATQVVSGMSVGATQTLTVSSTPSGTPRFKINGGPEVTSGTIQNGDNLVFLMDAPATSNSSNIMTITAGSMTSKWRVWSGWDGIGTGVKRVFVTSTDPNGAGFGGVTGADTHCQSRASAAALGGTWKAIVSSTNELAWAVNRVGYNWNELRLVDGTTVVAYAPNLWSGLLSPIIKTEFGATRASTRVLSGTASNGKAYSSSSDLSNLFNWTGSTCSATYMQGNSSALTAGISQGYWLCQSDGALFCIEQ